MRNFIATSLAFVMLLASLGDSANAATKKSIFNRPLNLGCSVKYDMPSFSQASNSDENMSVFYSTQGKLTLQNPEALTKNSYISVNVAQPRQERRWWRFFRKGNVDEGENRFKLRVSGDKASWWNIPGRIWNWIWNKGVYVKYALVLTSKDDEKILETPEVKEGQKKKEVLDAEKFRKEVEKYYGKDKVTEFKETYINKLLDGIKSDPNLDPYDPFNVAEAGHLDTLQAALPAMDRNSYYTKKEADEVNKKIREDKSKVLAKLAQKCGDELITEGEVAKLSQIDKEQTFRLIVNNNIGDGGEADKLVLLLSNLAATGQSIEDDSSVNFVSYVQSVLPDRFNNPLTEADRNNINRAYEALQAAKYKPGFFKWLWNGIKYITPDIIKDFVWWVGNGITLGAYNERKQLLKTEKAIDAKQDELKNLEKDVAEATKNLDATNKELAAVKKMLEDRTTDLAQREALLAQQQSLLATQQSYQALLDKVLTKTEQKRTYAVNAANNAKMNANKAQSLRLDEEQKYRRMEEENRLRSDLITAQKTEQDLRDQLAAAVTNGNQQQQGRLQAQVVNAEQQRQQLETNLNNFLNPPPPAAPVAQQAPGRWARVKDGFKAVFGY